ncbi:MAG TPA: PEP-CTERM sorting domain-containing protein [Bryobacteraceae bacterium]|nr:PEP-CTERM sorting domain-containing protein [Bryobacteraceae bacterium]
MNTRRFLIVAICAVVSALSVHVIVQSLRQTAPLTRRTVASGAQVSAAARALRPNYPYSVIPGGAYSPAELRFVNDRDSLVRNHYSDFNMNDAHLVVLTADRYQYASFRLNHHIFWTRHRLLIPKGEVLLTDGHNYARTRCGNRLSNTAKADTTPLQPPDSVLSLPPFSPELLKGPIALAPTPPIGELAQRYPVLPFESPRLAPYLPTGTEAELRLPESDLAPEMFSPVESNASPYRTPLSFPPPGSSLPPPGNSIPPTPPVVEAEVPEPESLLLFGIALCISGWLLGRMARANHKKRQD